MIEKGLLFGEAGLRHDFEVRLPLSIVVIYRQMGKSS